MNLSAKLMVGSAVIILFTAIQGMISVDRINQTGQLAGKLYDGPFMAMNFARSAKTNFLLLERQMTLATHQPSQLASEDFVETLTDLHESFQEDIEVVLERSDDARISENLDVVGTMVDDWWRLSEAAIASVEAGEPEIPAERLMEVAALVDGQLDLVIDFSTENGYEFDLSSEQSVAETRWFIIAVIIGTVIIGLLVAVAQGRMISRPITWMTRLSVVI